MAFAPGGFFVLALPVIFDLVVLSAGEASIMRSSHTGVTPAGIIRGQFFSNLK